MAFLSQAGQDQWVCDTLKYKKKGFFLDIGAHNGVSFSNSFYLEKVLGWDGICVEAGTNLFNLLRKKRSCLCVNKAITNKDGFLRFSEAGFGGCISDEGNTEVDGITMRSLLSMCDVPKVIDYISLDIEGHEVEALEQFPFDTHTVKLWTIEHNAYVDGGVEKEKIKAIMYANGYEIAKENVMSEGLIFEDWYINTKYNGLHSRGKV